MNSAEVQMVGPQLSHYRVLDKIGEGGMGVVYLAEDTRLERRVALKILPPEMAESPERLDRFEREAKAIAALNHPNIVSIHSIEAEDGVHFITMELVEGESLGDLIPSEGLSLEQFFDLAIAMADALSEAHSQGIVHRDLKPANIMVDAKGRPKILDFGLAKLRRTVPVEMASEAPTEVMTEPGMVMGTYPYMSPEQAEGREADHRSDLFSLGIVLYEMATGERPFQGDSPVSLISSILKDEPKPVFEVRSDLPEGLAAILARCLEKRPTDRYESTAELREAFEELRQVVESGAAYPAARQPSLPAFLTEEEFEEAPPPVFVGRERELARLDEFLDKALGGQGQVVFVTGEAGTGKTALINALRRLAVGRSEELVMATGGCNAHTGAGDPYGPFRSIFALLAGAAEARWATGSFSRAEALRLWDLVPVTAETICHQAPDLIDIFIPGQTILDHALTAAAGAPWLKPLADLVERKRVLPPDAMLQQSALLGQCRTLVEVLAGERPLLLVLEDLHWSDSGSVNLLFELARGLTGSPVCIVGTYRPSEVALGRGEGRHPLETVLNELKSARGDVFVPLEQSGSRAFVDELIDSEPNQLSEAFRSTLFERTQGHALFTTELLHDMQERGVLRQSEAGEWIESPDLDWDALPARVEGAIGERIARLSEELRELLTLASVEGEDFTAEVLSRVRGADTRKTVHRLSQELEKRHRLVSASGLKRVNATRLSLFRFRHVLFQRYLYNDLDEAERAYLHEDVGRVLEDLYGEHTEEIAPQLARHFLEAGDSEKGIQYLASAGRRAVRMTANEEAIRHYRKALEILAQSPDSNDRDRAEAGLQSALALPLVATTGWASHEVGVACKRVDELTQHLGDDPSLLPMLWFLGSYYGVGGQLPEGVRVGERMLEVAKRLGDEFQMAMAHWTLGVYELWRAEVEAASGHLDKTIDYCVRNPNQEAVYLYGLDPMAAAMTWKSYALAHTGHLNQGREMADRALARARDLGQPYTLCFTLIFADLHLQGHLRSPSFSKSLPRILHLAERHGFPDFQSNIAMVGYLRALEGDPEEGRRMIAEGRQAYLQLGSRLAMTVWQSMAAAIERLAGDYESSMLELDQAFALAEETGEMLWVPELWRQKGELLLLLGSPRGKAEASFQRAIEEAREKGMRLLELRAACSLARLRRESGQVDEARATLEPLYSWFTEGFDLPDLQEAKALLDELKGG